MLNSPKDPTTPPPTPPQSRPTPPEQERVDDPPHGFRLAVKPNSGGSPWPQAYFQEDAKQLPEGWRWF